MKRLLVVLVVLCAGAAHAKAPARSVEKDYTFVEPRYGVSPPEAYLKGIYEFRFEPEAGERWVSISVEDLVVDNVPGLVLQPFSRTHAFCGSTSEPVRILPNKPVLVWLGEGSCDTPNVWGTGTHVAGTVTATFTR